jgi:hypothetical protein
MTSFGSEGNPCSSHSTLLCCMGGQIEPSVQFYNIGVEYIYPLHILQYCPCFIHCSPTFHPIHKGAERLLVEPTIDFMDTDSLDFQEEPHELLVNCGEFKKDSKCKGELKNIVPPKREIMVSTPPQEHLSGSLIVTTPSLSLKHLQHAAHNLKTYWRGNC